MIPEERCMAIIGQGRKVACPVCEKRVFSQYGIPYEASGIGQHMRKVHPEHYDFVLSTAKRLRSEQFQRELAAKHELQQRPHRRHIVTGAFLMGVVEELENLSGMMEPYYSQGNCADPAQLLINTIESMIASKGVTEKEVA